MPPSLTCSPISRWKLVHRLLDAIAFAALLLYRIIEALVLEVIPQRVRFKDVAGETALVTGAASGIGRLLALRLAGRGCRLVLWDVDARGNEQTAEMVRATGTEARAYVCDVSDRTAVYATARRVKEEFGRVTILVNNAGVVTGRRFLDIPDEDVVRNFGINALAHFWTCKAFLPDMMDINHGHVVSIASIGGLGGLSLLTDYCSSKAAAIAFEESLRLELKSQGYSGIRSTVVCPFFVATGMFEGVVSPVLPVQSPESAADAIVSAILTDREVAFVPRYYTYLFPLKAVLPSSVYYMLYQLFGGADAMATFVGRRTHDHRN